MQRIPYSIHEARCQINAYGIGRKLARQFLHHGKPSFLCRLSATLSPSQALQKPDAKGKTVRRGVRLPMPPTGRIRPMPSIRPA